MRERFPTAAYPYVFSLGIMAAAVAVRWLLEPWLADSLALVTLPPAVAAAVWLGGFLPAALAAVLGYLVCNYLFISPPSTGGGFAGFDEAATLIGFLAYIVSGAVIIGLGHTMRSARLHARRRQEVLWTTLASIGDGVITTDNEARVTYLNAVAQSLTGWTLDGAEGERLDDVFRVVNEQTRRSVENPAVRALREGAIVGLANHSVLIARDGTERPIDDSAAPIRDEHGRVGGCVLVFRDITERRRAQQALERSERELSDFFETARVALHWVDRDGTILRANRAELDLLGYPREEYIGRNIAEFHVEPTAIEDILARLARGEALDQYPAQVRRKDGSIRDVVLSSNALWDGDTLVHSRCFTLDVTERKRSEETRALLASIVAASDDAIVSKTLQGTILSWNAAAERLFGYTADEAIGRPINLIIPPDRHDEERSILERLARGESVDHFETQRLTKAGRLIDLSLTISPVRDDAGEIIGASKVARDIGDRKRAEGRLREADRRKDEFLATLAHELRNPLAPIRHSLEIVKRAEGDPDVAREAYEAIERQFAHMVRLVDDLLDVSRITRGQVELRKARIELGSIVEQVVETYRPEAEGRDQRIEVTLPERPVPLDADPVRLAQVFGNLLSNACKYTPRAGVIRIAAEREGGEAMVSVQDSGIGMPQEELEGIFEMFAQVDTARERTSSGLGIGLTLVKRLVELHDGRVEAWSAGLGLGSTFTLRLPVAAQSGEKGAPAPAVPQAPMLEPRRILVVDDNTDSAESLATLLELSGHETEAVYDGPAALEAAERLRPHAVVLDIGLPKMSGIEVCRLLRAQPWGREMAVIALTGWGQEDDLRKSREAGFDAHLVKPVDRNDLLEQLASLLA